MFNMMLPDKPDYRVELFPSFKASDKLLPYPESLVHSHFDSPRNKPKEPEQKLIKIIDRRETILSSNIHDQYDYLLRFQHHSSRWEPDINIHDRSLVDEFDRQYNSKQLVPC
jgi:hypothetical protein